MFFFIWGIKVTEKKLGYVAEYCTTCREVRTVKIIRVGRTVHLYYIPLGYGKLLGYDGVCRKCELRFGVQVTDYLGFESDKNADLAKIAEKTNPKLLAGNEAAMAASKRTSDIRDPFLRYERNLLQRSLSGGLDRWSGLAYLLTFAVPIGLLYAASALDLWERAGDWIGWSAFVLFVAGLIGAGWLARTVPARHFRRDLEAQLIDEVRKLSPTRRELEDCLAGLRKFDYAIARLVSLEKLLGNEAVKAPTSFLAPRPAQAAPPVPPPPRSLEEDATFIRMPEVTPAQSQTLLITHGGKEYHFSPGVADIVIGRARENAIVLNSKFVSRAHVQIAWSLGSAPRLKNLSPAGTAILLEGASRPVECKGEVPLKGRGQIGLAKDFSAAEAEGDVLYFQVVA